MIVRAYTPADYQQVAALYQNSATFGGQFDPARDSQQRLDDLIASKPDSILLVERDGVVVGSVTVFEDGRSCWLYRFAVLDEDQAVVAALADRAKAVCQEWGHEQMLVYAPAGDEWFEQRYTGVGFEKGGEYTCYWLEV